MKRFLLLLSIVCSSAFAAAPDVAVPLDPAVRMGTLANGLTYYIRKNAKPEKRVELRLAVNAGSIQEDDDQLGLAHFVEHMAFNGTQRFPKNDLIHYLQSLGMAFGPELNAFTSFDETVYMLTLPSDNEESLLKGIQIMGDWAHAVTLNPADIDKERSVIVEEWRLGRGANQRMLDRYLPVLFKDSKYAQRLAIGTKESIEGSSVDSITRFYRDWYRPDNMALVVVGDIDPDKILATIQTEIGVIPEQTQPRAKLKVSVPDNDQPLCSIVSDRENPYNVIQLYFKTPRRDYGKVTEYRQGFAEQLFVQMLNNRLGEIVQQPNPPFMHAGASFGKIYIRAKDGFQLFAVVPDNGFQRGLAAVLTEAERVQRCGFTAAELDRAKRTMGKGMEQAFNERDKTQSGQLAGALVEHFLNTKPAPGIEYDYAFAQEHLGGIRLEEVNHLSTEWITPKNRVVILLSVEKDGVKIPTETELQAIGQQVTASTIAPYQEAVVASSLLATVPTPGTIIEEKLVPEIGVTELRFANGVRVVLKPTTFQNDEILFSACRPGGQSVFAESYNLSAQLAPVYLSVAGLANFSVIDLQKILAGKKLMIQPKIETYFDGLAGKCSLADRETLFQLMYLVFTQPRRDEGAFQSIVMRMQAFLKNQLTNPVASFANEAQKSRYANHPRTQEVLPTDAEWATVTLDKVMEIAHSRFDNAAGYTFVFVGAFSVDAIKPLLATYLGSLPGQPGPQAWKDMGLRSVKGPVDQSFNRGADPKSLVRISLEGPALWTRDESHRLWSLGSILQRTYLDKLREEMGGVYGFKVAASISQVPYGHYAFDLMLPCAPDNVQKLSDAAYAEIKRIQANGPTPEELQKEIETQRRAAEKNATDNSAWVWQLEQIYREGETFGRLINPEEMIALLTGPELQRVAQQYLHTEEALRYTLYPEKK